MGNSSDRLMKPLRIYKSPSVVPSLSFSDRAEVAVERRAEAHRQKLITHSRALAASQDLDLVSKVHVDRAGRDLSEPGRVSKKHASTIGGILAGASLSSLMSLIFTSDGLDRLFALALLASFVLGLYLIAVGQKLKT